MKKLSIYILSFLVLVSCGSKTELETKVTTTPKTPVKVVSIDNGNVDNEISLFGKTIYLKRNIVAATIPAFITQVNVKLGDRVRKGDVLYVLQSKESRALGNDVSKIDSTLKNFGIIKITASARGIISTLDKQQSGDYVLEGTQLCTISKSTDLVFQVNVPYEFTPYTKSGRSCKLILPDNTEHSGTFTKALTTMNVTAQTQTILAKSNERLFLPENMIVRVMINIGTNSKKQILPKSCVLSDEMMREFWVMKLLNDSMAVKIPVTIGNNNSEIIEILSPQFNATDKIISTGNYGLPDTAIISIQSSEK